MRTSHDPAGRCRPGRTLAGTLAALLSAVAILAGSQAPQRARIVHVTVLGDLATPLAPADFVVKEDGKTRSVLEAAPATAPLSVALLLDDKGSDINEIRAALAAFVQRLDGRAEVSLVSVVPTPLTLFDYTRDSREMLQGVRRLVWRSGPAGGLVLSAVADAADTLRRREAERPAIVVVTFEGEEFKSHRPAEGVLQALERSRAALHVVAVGRPNVRRMNRAAVESGDAQGDDWIVDGGNRQTVLSEGPRQSGGRRQELAVATGLTRALETVASELMSQYRLVYEGAAEGKGSRKLNVSTRRRGVTVRAPGRVIG